jgi:hypothetical protein
MTRIAAAFTAIALSAFAATACSRPASHHLLDTLMSCVDRPSQHRSLGPLPSWSPAGGAGSAPYELLAGDLHCHISPPDRPPHVSRGLDETLALAEDEGLDFVVLTPHIRAPFFVSQPGRERALTSLTRLRESVAKHARGKTTFIVGFEYTDFAYGHVGAAFADLGEVLAAVPVDEAQERPGRFFEEYVARGGLLTINHPLLVPLESTISIARWDLSWQPFSNPGGDYPDEIRAADRLAHGLEVFNMAMFELRDRFLLGDSHASTRDTFARLDKEILARGRRMIPIGGSDSHSGHLRATTFVLSRGRDPGAIREALLAGRICVRDPIACTFEVRGGGGPWLTAGSSLSGVSEVSARARGETTQILVNGKVIEAGAAEITIPLDKTRCSVIRARVDGGYSAPIYVNCPF